MLSVLTKYLTLYVYCLTSYSCGLKTCLSRAVLCDGVEDCRLGLDERNCRTLQSARVYSRHDESAKSMNRGNFREILNLVANHDDIVRDRWWAVFGSTLYSHSFKA